MNSKMLPQKVLWVKLKVLRSFSLHVREVDNNAGYVRLVLAHLRLLVRRWYLLVSLDL